MSFVRKIQYNAPVTLTYAILSLLVLFLGFITNGSTNLLLFSVYRSSWLDPLSYFRLFSHVLGHIHFMHYFNNFVLILLLGPMLEEKYGSKNILMGILFTAFITGVLNNLFFSTALLGASGVVFMLIVLSSFVNMKKGKIPLTLILVFCIFLGKEVVSGLSADQISQVTHIAGGICGAFLGLKLNNR